MVEQRSLYLLLLLHEYSREMRTSHSQNHWGLFVQLLFPFYKTNPILERNDLAQVFSTVISPPFCDRRDGSRCSSMPVVAATTIDLFTIPPASQSAWIYSFTMPS